MRLPLYVAGLLLLALSAFGAGSVQDRPELARLKADPSIQLLQDASTGQIRYMSGRLAENISAGEEVEATLEFFERNRAAYRMTNPRDEIKVKRLDVDPLGMRHVRLTQSHEGVRVYGSSMIAHFSSEGIFKAINGTYVENVKIDTNPQLAASEAIDAAQVDLQAFFGPGEPNDPELVVFPWEGKTYLAWQMELFSASPMGRWEYFVDAKTGEVVFKANRIMDANDIGTGTSVMGDARTHIDTDFGGSDYSMIDYTRRASNDPHGHGGQMGPSESITTYVSGASLPGVIAVDADNVWSAASQASAVDGHVYTALVYDWMLARFGRNSFDDNGGTMITSVDYSAEGDNNAYWNGFQMVVWSFGTGWRSLAGCPDVIAHEWGHAVTDYTSDLVYQKESGALNESFSDMMGAAFEFAHGSYDTPDWYMGENGRTSGTPFRDMSNPPARGDPDTYEGTFWVNVDGCTPSNGNDQCGVHTNSGVGNKWFYLLSDGGLHNGVNVTGIGVVAAMDVAYRANSFYWTQFSTYSEAAYGTVSAATDLDPSGVYEQSVRDAWEAVGVSMPLPYLVFDYPTGLPALLTPDVTTQFDVMIDATFDGSVSPASGDLVYRIDGGTEQPVAMVELAAGHYQATLPAVSCGQTLEYRIEASEATEGVFLDPWIGWNLAAPGTDETSVFSDDFESDLGWSATGDWGRGTPFGGGGQYGGPDPTSAVSGTNVYGYNLFGDYPDNMSEETLTSPAIDCSGLSNIHLKFQRWLGVEQPAYDHAYIRITNNGGATWSTVWSNSVEITDTEWVAADIDISGVAAGQSEIFIRFVMGSSDGGWHYCGWNIDDVEVTGYTCELIADSDIDGVADFEDNCPTVYNPGQADTDGDLVGDFCDVCEGFDDAQDVDGDTVPDGCDACAGFDDLADADTDAIPDGCDNCVDRANPDQADANADQIGDACCCVGIVGDANGEGSFEPTIGDISTIVDLLFITQSPIDCLQEADINQSGGIYLTIDDITIGDISTLIDYLFITGESLGINTCL